MIFTSQSEHMDSTVPKENYIIELTIFYFTDFKTAYSDQTLICCLPQILIIKRVD